MNGEMNRAHTEDTGQPDHTFQYVVMDISNVYLGARYSLQGLMEEDRVPFKLKAVISHYILKEVDQETTLESLLYYLEQPQSGGGRFVYETLRQLRVKVKVYIPEEKKKRRSAQDTRGEGELLYKERIWSLEQLAGMNLAQKKAQGLIVRELIVSKIGLMSFSV